MVVVVSVGGGSGGGGGGGLAVVMVCGSKKPTALQRVFHFAHIIGREICLFGRVLLLLVY